MTVSIIGLFLKIAVMKIGALCLQRTCNFINTKAVVRWCSLKKMFLEILRNSRESTCTRVFFLKFIKKETVAQVFSCEFWEMSKNTFFYRTPLVAASAYIQSLICPKDIVDIFPKIVSKFSEDY